MSGSTPAGPTSDNTLFIWLAGIASAVIIQFFIRIFITRADYTSARINELCAAIDEIPFATHEYWVLEQRHPDFQQKEALLSGHSHKITALAGLLIEGRPKLREILRRPLFELSLAATGGNFQVNDRTAEPYRYRDVQARAHAMIGALRRYQQKLRVRVFG
jgi:hypothetical protein